MLDKDKKTGKSKEENGLVVIKSGDDGLAYEVKKYDSTIELRCSTFQSTWTKKGALSSKLIDNGDGLKFISYDVDGKVEKEVELDYSQAEEFRTLLKMNDRNKTTFKYFKQEGNEDNSI